MDSLNLSLSLQQAREALISAKQHAYEAQVALYNQAHQDRLALAEKHLRAEIELIHQLFGSAEPVVPPTYNKNE